MRVLLLGATGNLGRRCIAALVAHGHVVTVFIRSPSKLESLISPALLARIKVFTGDATDPIAIRRALLQNHCDALVDVAGNQVLPWHEFLLPKIAKAVTEAAIEVGKDRGKPLRAWICCGLGVLALPESGKLLMDYLPKFAGEQHAGTRNVVQAVNLDELRWSLMCVAMMNPEDPAQSTTDLIPHPRPHNLLLAAGTLPAWNSENSWIAKIPFIGTILYICLIGAWKYTTKYEDIAGFMAEDLASGSDEWVGSEVGMKEKEKSA